MDKTTLFGFTFANPFAIVMLIFFFNATNAQSVVYSTKQEEKSIRFLSSDTVYEDSINSVLINQKGVFVENQNNDTICTNELVSILIEDKGVVNANFDIIMIVQYYKQFVILYKNIT
jgi:choline kinase